MKVNNSKAQQFLQNYRKPKQNQVDSNRQSTTANNIKDKLELNSKKVEHFQVEKNNPSDPTVSTKVLDSLSTGMINFNQEERDTIATILSNRAKEVSVKNKNA